VINRKARSSAFLGPTVTYSRGNSGYARGAQGFDRALPISRSQSHFEEATTMMLHPRQEGGHQERASKTTRG
jgi:hypothetical protein